ncbi:hypothetical protein L7F22_009099 [Adiantum nelumboides]|nr:hypothetical protein [Adiantum nelumboides]
MLKKDRFLASLRSGLRLKVELKQPRTFEEAVEFAKNKEWKAQRLSQLGFKIEPNIEVKVVEQPRILTKEPGHDQQIAHDVDTFGKEMQEVVGLMQNLSVHMMGGGRGQGYGYGRGYGSNEGFAASSKLDPLQWSTECEEVFQRIKEVLGSLPTMQAPNWDKEFYVNPSVGEDAIGAMLLQQGTNSHYMKPIYCASRVKLEVERDYTDVELIMVSVVYACRRFRHYLLPKRFTFLTSYTLLPQLVNSPTLSKRLMKFNVEFQEFQFSFLVEESTRSTLADLLTYKEAPLLVKEDTLKKQHMEAPDIDNAFLLFFDGSYRKSHNEASGGVVIYDPQGNLVTKRGLKLTAQSNNEAEYATLEKGLQLCLELGIQRVKVKGDALLVVKQVLGVWQSKNPRLKNMCFHVKNLLKHFEAWSIRHIDRSHNEEAHAAAQAMIGQLYVIRADSPPRSGDPSYPGDNP